MKTVLASLLVMGFGMTAIADGPHIEPGPVQELSKEAGDVADILLNPQLKDCVKQLQNAKFDITNNKVTFQGISPGNTRYQIKGLAIQGGDIVVGETLLDIFAKETDGVFGNKVNVYTCNVVLPK